MFHNELYMDGYLKVVKKNRPSLVFLSLFVIVGGFLLTIINKGDVVVWLNARHSVGLDYFMMVFNKSAEWVWVCCLLLVVYKPYYGFVSAAMFAVNGALVQFFKIIVFNYPRPFAYLEGIDPVVVFDMELGSKFSFPSGHTNAMFVGGLVLGLLSNNKWLMLLGMISGLLTGFSRIYFFQHFFMDIYAGGILAVLVGTYVYMFFENSKFNSERFKKPFWVNS